MRILVDIGHPAHVHQFKNMIRGLEAEGHEFKITARDKEMSIGLLDAYGFDYVSLGKPSKGIVAKTVGAARTDKRLLSIAKEFKPDVLVGGSGNLYVAHVGWLIKKRSIIFEDSEPEQKIKFAYEPMVTNICVPEGFKGSVNSKYVRVKSYKELAYLHPDNFTPDISVLERAGIVEGERFTLVRFVGWEAGHDTMKKGLDLAMKIELVEKLSKHVKVLISSEGELPEELKRYQMTIKPHEVHDLMSFASLIVTDGQTMATEGAVLGIPVVRSGAFVGSMSNFDELENDYGLMFSIKEGAEAVAKALELISDSGLLEEWQIKRQKLLDDKIDMSKFMMDFILEGG